MIPADQHIWRLSEAGRDSLGLCCTRDGLLLGSTPLVELQDGGYVIRPREDLERLLRRAYDVEIPLDRVLAGLAVAASALAEDNLCLAQIAAVQLRLPDLPDIAARERVEAEDALIKRARTDDAFTRTWEEAKHPRVGVPPNPGWFVPAGAPSASPRPIQVAQGEEEERAPEEILDPLGSVRQAVWEARIALLRRIDPANPNLTYFANPGTPPSPEALHRLNAAIETAAIKRVADRVMPNGVPIGRRGGGLDIQELSGGAEAARSLYDYLRVGGTEYLSEPNITVIQLPGRAGFITFRPKSRSGDAAVDVNVPGIRLKLHFP